MNPLLTGITRQVQQANNQQSDSVQSVFQKMLSGQINPKDFMLDKIKNLPPEEKARFKQMLNNGIFKNIANQSGYGYLYNDFYNSVSNL